MKKTGIVMEIEDGKAYILLQNGNFRSVLAEKDWKAGDVVAVKGREGRGSFRTGWWAAAALFFLLTVTGITGMRAYYKENMILSVDINPAVELVINRFGFVIRTEAWNEEGAKILAVLDLKNKKYEKALELLLSSEELKRYLDSDPYVMLALQSEDASEKLLQEIADMADGALEQCHGNVALESCMVSKELLSAAHEHGMTAGKYSVVLELLDTDSSLSEEEYAQMSICEMKDHAAHCVEHRENEKHGGCRH